MTFIINNWQGLIALTALIVSIGSTVISFFTFKLQRTHNIKSVTPIIHVGQWDYENRVFVTLANVGSGISLVKKLSVVNKHGKIENNLYDWCPKKLSDGVNYKEYWTPYKNFVIQPGQEIKLMEFSIDVGNIKQVKVREKLRAILRQLTVNVEYTDIYDNQMPITNVELSHFSRTDNENSAD